MKTSLHLAEQSMEQTGIALTQGRTDQFEDVVSCLQFLIDREFEFYEFFSFLKFNDMFSDM